MKGEDRNFLKLNEVISVGVEKPLVWLRNCVIDVNSLDYNKIS